jgi:hypothetical protein
MTDTFLSNLISTVVGAIVGGGCSIWASAWATKKASKNLETSEIRRQKVKCIVVLTGLRWVIGNDQSVPNEYKARLLFELNKIQSLWADDPQVMKGLKDFYTERTNPRFISLLRHLGTTTKSLD